MTDFAGAYHRLNANARGALWMLASSLVFTFMVALIKYLGDTYSPALQTFYRQAAGLIVLTPIILRDPKAALTTNRIGLLMFRAACLSLGMILSFYAYQEMPLADANALSFSRTLWMVPLAIFILRETVGAWRLGATLTGFLGVLIMMRPSAETAFSLPALAMLLGGLLIAAGITGMKIMTRDHSLTTLTVWGAILGVLFTTPLALLEWRWPNAQDLLLLATMGALGLVSQIFYIKGIALGDAAAMAPIDYTRLVFALIVGVLFFHETPDLMTMLGAAVVVAATLIITVREQRQKKAPPVALE